MAQSLCLSHTNTIKVPFSTSGEELLRSSALKTKPTHVKISSGYRARAGTSLSAGLGTVGIPHQWYNLIADLPLKPPPPLHPKTFEPVKPEDLSPLFPDELIKQEASNDRFIDIPEEVRDIYQLWRPTPLIRAKRLEKLLDTPARIYYKYEGVSPAGSHKPNSAVPQVWYNAQEGVKNVVTETGAGQWGSALAFACSLFGVNCEVWQVRASFDQKPYRKLMMQTWGAKVHPSPSNATDSGRRILQMDPQSPGSLGIAISEAVEVAAKNADTKYCLGSVLNHVLLHQTVIGEECIKQMEAIGETPDVIIGCTGGGSNFAGLSFPFIRDKLKGKINPLIRAVEPAACPSLTQGVYAYDYGDTAGFTPLMKMHTLGHDFVPDPIHAGGLRYISHVLFFTQGLIAIKFASFFSCCYWISPVESGYIRRHDSFQSTRQSLRTAGGQNIFGDGPSYFADVIVSEFHFDECANCLIFLLVLCPQDHCHQYVIMKMLQSYIGFIVPERISSIRLRHLMQCSACVIQL
ncbi:hypothetical protein RHGRI_023156 [Rhododendron griersonianum]|uniref:tryptophan synthase n=1 Tax=Rhododendron griersonianum TaxID=479676 RepID=A0AAV6J289_9ERIC|nr:hypothetical protein RHGRI_023156 [Rhododendron griersonianum]